MVPDTPMGRRCMHHRKARNQATGRTPIKTLALAVAIAACLPVPAVAQQSDGGQEAVVEFDIPAEDLSAALDRFSTQSGTQAMYRQELVAGKRASALSGSYTPAAALERILRGTGLVLERANDRTFVLKEAHVRPQAQPTQGSTSPVRTSVEKSEPTALAAVLVKGSKSLNVDIERTRDDIQPYVVFSREEIEGSLATNIEEFLGTRLPMNQTRGTASRNEPGNGAGNRSRFDLRGLGPGQTLILINGRRAPGVSLARSLSNLDQADLNGIPIGSVERIEVLPATASGIYGGGATGGVINVVLRKDYDATTLRVGYDNSFDTDSGRRMIDISTGFAANGGKTTVALSASFLDANRLLAGDRGFTAKARQRALQNVPPTILRNQDIYGRHTNFASVDGSDLVFKDGTPFGAAIGSVPVGYAGVPSDGGAGLAAGAGEYNLEIPLSIAGKRQGLFSSPTTRSVYGALTQEIGDRIEAYLDIARNVNKSEIAFAPAATMTATLPASSPGNPFQQAIRVRAGVTGHETTYRTESISDRINAGLTVRLPREWSAGLDLNASKSTNTFTYMGETFDRTALQLAMWGGAFDLLRDLEQYPPDLSPYWNGSDVIDGPAHSTLKEASVRAAGPLFRLPAGTATMTAMVSSRRNRVDDTYTGPGPYQYHPPRHQDVDSLYAEAAIPLVSGAQSMPFVHSLHAQVSVRRDAYTTISVPPTLYLATPDRETIPAFSYSTNKFASTDYTFGIKYEPIDSLALRASHGTGFMPPGLTQIAGTSHVGSLYVADPKRSGASELIGPISFTNAGGNENLEPERSTSTSVGLIFTPPSWSGTRISLDYTRIEKHDEITRLSFQQIVNLEDSFPGRVTRGPNLPGDPPGWAGQISAIDASEVNVANSLVEAFDVQVDVEKSMGSWGLLHFYGVGTWQTALKSKVFADDPFGDRVGHSDGPLRWRGNVGVNWQLGDLQVGLNTQYYDSYKVYSSLATDSLKTYAVMVHGSDRVPSQAYTNASVGYRFANGPLGGLKLVLGLRNVFDKAPPIIGTLTPTGGYSTYGDPRMRTYVLSAEYTF